MLSHIEMAPAAAGFKLFGKIITQCAEGGAAAAAVPQPAPVFAAREEEEERPDRATIKREAAELEHDEQKEQQKQQGGAGGQAPRRTTQQQLQEAAEARAAAAAPLPCPRCRSRDTKFCYFNNYNVNQPRHFCKACHRYWTAGGALRNVPVGAGRRKNRPLGPVAAHHHHHHRAPAAGAAGFVLGFPNPNPSSPTSPSPPAYTDRWPVGPDRRF